MVVRGPSSTGGPAGRAGALLACLLSLGGTLTGCSLGPIYEGDIYIDRADDVAMYQDVEEVNGNLWIDQSDLTTLAGLERIEWVGGDLVIGGDRGNRSLVSLEGLQNLQRVEGNVSVTDNPVLADLGGLRGLLSTGQAMVIQRNDALSTFGMTSLESVGSYFTIDTNIGLTNLDGLEGLHDVDFTLAITSNTSLSSLYALRNLRSAGRLYVRYNIALPTCAAENLRQQIEALGGFARYDGEVEIIGNDDDASCEGAPLGS